MTVSIHDVDGLSMLARKYRIEPEALRRFRNAFYKKHLPPTEAVTCISQEVQSQFLQQLETQFLSIQQTIESGEDDARRLCFRTIDDVLIETVLMTASSGRTSVCLSCQSGCPLDCVFCATGALPFTRGLTQYEILDQVVQAHQLCRELGKDLRNIVFMGMGEPLLHTDAVFAAIDVLLDSRCFNLSPRHIMVSTCGIPKGIKKLGKRFPDVGLAVSLHSAVPEVRRQLMPRASLFSLAELRLALEEVSETTRQEIMIEYMLLAGVNDSDIDAAALADFLSGLNVYVNLLTYNPTPRSVQHGTLAASPEDRFDYFSTFLQEKGFKVTKRYSHGRDINAACGQLAGEMGRH